MNADTVRELLNNATPGPWAYKAGIMKHYAHSTDPGEDFGVSLQEMHWQDGREVPAEGNARLIAAAPAVAQWGLERDAEVARLREALTHHEACDGAHLSGMAAYLNGLPNDPPADLMDTAPYAGPREMWRMGWEETRQNAEAEQEVARLREAVLLLLSVAQESWDQWAFHAPDGTRWEGGLSTLERLRGILGPLNLLNEDGAPVAHEALNFPYEDDDKIITAALPLLQSPE